MLPLPCRVSGRVKSYRWRNRAHALLLHEPQLSMEGLSPGDHPLARTFPAGGRKGAARGSRSIRRSAWASQLVMCSCDVSLLMVTMGFENPRSVGCVSDKWNQASGGQRQVGPSAYRPVDFWQVTLSLDFLVSKIGMGIPVLKGHEAQIG